MSDRKPLDTQMETEPFNDAQMQELRRLKQYFPYRIVFGVLDRETGKFEAYAKPTMHTANRLAREGHQVFVL